MIYKQEDLIRMISSLSNLHDKTAAFFNERNLEPAPGSKAILELDAFRRESVQTAYSQGNLLIETSADQLIALYKSLTEPVLTIAPFTSARALLESSALASWLLDLTINTQERVQRSFAFRFEGLSQQVTFARTAGLDTKETKKRIDDVEKLALSLGFNKMNNKKGKRIGIGQQFPKMADLIASVFSEEPVYRLLSAFIHAHSWAIQQLSFSQTKNNNSNNAFSSNKIGFEKRLNSEALIFLCHKSAHAFSRPLWNKVKLYGYKLSDFRKILDEEFDNLNFVKTSRFWNMK